MRIGFIALALVLAGCAGAPSGTNTPADPGPPPGPAISNEVRAMLEQSEAPFRMPGNVTARLGQEVQVGGLRVRPLQVLEDSRCPTDVDCIWAGRIRVKVAVSGAGEQVMELNRPVTVPGGRSLILVAVAPPNWHTPPPGVDPNAPLRFAFRLSGTD
jgi:hypothetical protein